MSRAYSIEEFFYTIDNEGLCGALDCFGTRPRFTNVPNDCAVEIYDALDMAALASIKLQIVRKALNVEEL